MITCWQRDRICGEGMKTKTKQLLAAKLSFLSLAYSIGMCRFLFMAMEV
jgi:hypothetical protein